MDMGNRTVKTPLPKCSGPTNLQPHPHHPYPLLQSFRLPGFPVSPTASLFPSSSFPKLISPSRGSSPLPATTPSHSSGLDLNDTE